MSNALQQESSSLRGKTATGVVLVRFSALGDCVLLCPLAERLKRGDAGEIVVVTKKSFAELFAAATGVDRVVAYDSKSGLGGLWRVADGLRNRGYRVIDAHATLRSRVLCGRMGRPMARFDKRYRDRLGLIVLKRPAAIPTMLEQYGALAGALGIDGNGLRPGGLTLSDQARETASAITGNAGSDRWIAIAPGSRWPTKTWEGRRFAEVARRFAAKGFRIAVLGDAREREVAAIVADAAGSAGLAFAGTGNIMETAAILERCETMIGNDSGLVHLAEAFGVPVVALYGPTVESFGYYPSLPRSRTIEFELSCRPCSRNGATPCLRGTHECMSAIDVDTVEAAASDLLAGRDQPRYRVTGR